MQPLEGFNIVSLAINAPGPVAAARLRDYGASVTKVEPPTGDPLSMLGTGWYEELTAGMTVRALDLKQHEGRTALDALLSGADLLLTAQRPRALAKLGLDWETLHQRFPQLCWVAIVGFPPPRENEPGHDLTYQADYGTVNPPQLPRVLVADLAGAERAASEAVALLLTRERGSEAAFRYVALSRAAAAMAVPVQHGVTAPGGVLGGGIPNYNIYWTADGYLAVAALEPHFFNRLCDELRLNNPDYRDLEAVFLTRTAREWEDWALERDLPLAAIRTP